MKDQKNGHVCEYSVNDILGQTINALIDRGYRFSIMQDEVVVEAPKIADDSTAQKRKRVCSRI